MDWAKIYYIHTIKFIFDQESDFTLTVRKALLKSDMWHEVILINEHKDI